MASSCPICGSDAFTQFGDRPLARCLGCDSLERHRALAAVSNRMLADGQGRSCLEAGPLNAQVFGGYLRNHGWAYTSIDQSRAGNPHDPRDVRFVEREAGLTDL